MASFNSIAPYYDSLSELVFGNNLNKAKKHFIHQLPPNSKILLIAGGTGAILNELLQLLPEAVVDYVEPSEKMIAIAKKKVRKELLNRIHFICGDHHAIPENKEYDAVTSFFVLDCFNHQEAVEFSKAVTSCLKRNGAWLFADFFTQNSFHRLLVWSMYRFFRVTAKISASRLPDYECVFRELNFQCCSETDFLSGLIRSKILNRKTESG